MKADAQHVFPFLILPGPPTNVVVRDEKSQPDSTEKRKLGAGEIASTSCPSRRVWLDLESLSSLRQVSSLVAEIPLNQELT
jgi:hypothetical protein